MAAYSSDFKHLFSNLGQSYLLMVCFVNAFSGKLCDLKRYNFDGNHEAIVKNIHELLVKLAWDFSPNQLDHLFGCFQKSWVGASKKQRDELLDFIRRLAEDDKEGIMASKTDLLFFVENLISAITSSARSCPSVMKRIIHLLQTLSVKQFPEFEDKVQFNSISGFIFLRFFASAILNPKLFGLRPENPNHTVSRTLLLISKLFKI
uniref:Ras-GAP domain-containing protein n=1 Tax=Amphimedon queenslandica TaxID=400682 RepID=A0A1X7TCM3_AMPQE